MALALIRAIGAPILLLIGLGNASLVAAQVADDKVILSVGGEKITRQDLEVAVKNRVPENYETVDKKKAHEIRLLILKNLILEKIVDSLLPAEAIKDKSALARKLETARRDLLLDYFIGNKLIARRPNDVAIDDYIRKHPEEFQGRKMYQYAELIINAGSETTKKAVIDRLKLFEEFKRPDTKTTNMLVQWLGQNRIQYGYASVWKETEELPPAIKADVMTLANSESKVAISNNGLAFRILVLFGAYDDPRDPLWSKNLVAQRIMHEDSMKQGEEIVSSLIAHGGVKLYDANYKDLNIPVGIQAAPVEAKLIANPLIVWNFLLFFLLLAALYAFATWKDEETEELSYKTVWDVVAENRTFRGVSITICTSLILFFIAEETWGAQQEKSSIIAISAILAISIACCVFFLATKIGGIRRFFTSRWAPIMIVAALQAVGLFAVDLLGIGP